MSGASIRSRLATGYAAAVATAVLVYGVVLFVSVRGSLFEQLDDRLHDDYEAIEHRFEETPGGGLRWLDAMSADEPADESQWVEVVGPEGSVRLRRPETPRPTDVEWRTHVRKHSLGANEYTIRVGRSSAGVRRELDHLLLLLGLCALPVLVLAYVAGRVLAGRALAPVEAMTARAREITAERLSERLPVADPGDELGRLATVFNETFARLERAFDQLRRFTADASHELRTPLTALKAVGEVSLREPKTPEQYRDVIGSMLEEAERLARLVDALLTLSRADAGHVSIRREPLRLLDVARDVAARLGVLAEEKSMTLAVEGDGDAEAHADPVVLRQALANLVDNAIKFGPPKSRVTVRVGARGPESSVEVIDEGPGIPEEHRARIFDRFYRVDESRARGGVGLGLAIAKWAAEANGGRIELESRDGTGSTFRIVLPSAAARSGDEMPAGSSM